MILKKNMAMFSKCKLFYFFWINMYDLRVILTFCLKADPFANKKMLTKNNLRRDLYNFFPSNKWNSQINQSNQWYFFSFFQLSFNFVYYLYTSFLNWIMVFIPNTCSTSTINILSFFAYPLIRNKTIFIPYVNTSI